MNEITTQPRRIRSFFIKDILEHGNPTTEEGTEGPRTSSIQNEQSARTNSTAYTVQHILTKEDRPIHPCSTGCCNCAVVYPAYKNAAMTTPFYSPYLYAFYRQQPAWRHSLKDGVSFVNQQNFLYSQAKQRKPRRPWTRAVFSNLQRKGLEKRFQVQKYLTKGDRHQLASMLGLSDNQVKVWFQNRRMKWRQEEQNGDDSTDKSEFLPNSNIPSSLKCPDAAIRTE